MAKLTTGWMKRKYLYEDGCLEFGNARFDICSKGLRRFFDLPECTQIRLTVVAKETKDSLPTTITPCDCGCGALFANETLLNPEFSRLLGKLAFQTIHVECEYR